MKIEHEFEYDAYYTEIADEFCDHDSEYQAEAINSIGLQFKTWTYDKTRTTTYIQLLEIAEQLNENGRWFIKTLCDYMKDKTEIDPQESEKISCKTVKCENCPNHNYCDYEPQTESEDKE